MQERLDRCEEERLYVRELRIAYDAVMVGAGTIRVDDPQLTVRPPHDRLRPYVRVVVCESDTFRTRCRVFAPSDGYAKTIVLAPAGARERFRALRERRRRALHRCRPTKRARPARGDDRACANAASTASCAKADRRSARGLIAAGVVDRVYWAIAPVFPAAEPNAVPVLAGVDMAAARRDACASTASSRSVTT